MARASARHILVRTREQCETQRPGLRQEPISRLSPGNITLCRRKDRVAIWVYSAPDKW